MWKSNANLKEKKQDEDHGGWRWVSCASFPVAMDAIDEMIDAKEEAVVRHDANVKCEQNKEFLKGDIFGLI